LISIKEAICFEGIFRSISNEKIMKRFAEMKERHMLIPQRNIVIAPNEE